MWRTPRNVPAPAPDTKEISAPSRIVRRVSVTVERQVCSIEVRATLPLQPGMPCPVCGQTLPHPAAPALPEPPPAGHDG